MPQTSSDDSGSASDEVVYPIDLLREAAAKILVNATLALEQHDLTWRMVQAYINESGPRAFNFWSPNQNQLDAQINVQPYLEKLLTPHAQRLRASYEWQIKLASTLFEAIDSVEGTDNDVAQSFQTRNSLHRNEGF